MKRSKIRISVTPKEIRALIIGLQEYLYIVEEGNLREILEEMEGKFGKPASASQANDLLDRLRFEIE